MQLRKFFILLTGSYMLISFSMAATYFVTKHSEEGGVMMNGYPKQLIELIILPIKLLRRYYKGNNEHKIKNYEINDGITIFNQDKDYDNLSLLTSYIGNDKTVVELINISDGKTIKKWSPDFKKITQLTYEGSNRLGSFHEINQLSHPLILKDSSIIANTSYSLVRIDGNSQIKWVKSNHEAHHSIELDHEGNIWIASRRLKSKRKELRDKEDERLLDDLIMKIDPTDGKIIFEKSVIQILIDNNLYDLVYKNGNYVEDPIHLNDVQPALTESDYWDKGDLLISARHLSAIFLYRPSTNKIIWFKQGPWLNQHDPDFLEENRISVFGNQVFEGEMEPYLNPPSKYNSVFIYDFETDQVSEPFKAFLESEKVMTTTGGRSEILPNGDLFIDETNNGRVLIGDTINKKVSFARRLNDEHVSHLFWSRIIK